MACFGEGHRFLHKREKSFLQSPSLSDDDICTAMHRVLVCSNNSCHVGSWRRPVLCGGTQWYPQSPVSSCAWLYDHCYSNQMENLPSEHQHS